MSKQNTTGTTLPHLGWEVREQDRRGWVEGQKRFAAKRRTPPIQKTHFANEAEARAHAATLRSRSPHPDFLIAVVPIRQKISAQPSTFDGAERHPWSSRRPPA
jgi:hypothetical protein